jgi:hypothetical protein
MTLIPSSDPVSYDEFLGLFAMSAMPGALLDATFNFFGSMQVHESDAYSATLIGMVIRRRRGRGHSCAGSTDVLPPAMPVRRQPWWAVPRRRWLCSSASPSRVGRATTWMRSFSISTCQPRRPLSPPRDVLPVVALSGGPR